MSNLDFEVLKIETQKMNEKRMLNTIKNKTSEIIYLWLTNGKDFPRINAVEKNMKNHYIFSAYEFVVINDINIETDDPTKYSLVFFGFDEFGNSIIIDFKKIDKINIDRFNKYIELLSSFIKLLKNNKEIIETKNNKLKIINNIVNMAIKEIENERDK